jgi:hypothetical protein
MSHHINCHEGAEGREETFSPTHGVRASRARVSSLSRIHDQTHDAPQSVGLFWTSDRPDAKT